MSESVGDNGRASVAIGILACASQYGTRGDLKADAVCVEDLYIM
jgi:hypothetical protein